MPPDAMVGRKGIVTWTAKGKKRTGKLSGTGKVNVQSDTWTAQFTDETGKVRRVSTKTVNRAAAEKILARHEAEIDRIKSGVVTRAELTKAQVQPVTLDDALRRFRTKMVADGSTERYINGTMQQILSLLQESSIDSLAALRRDTIERWIADEIQRKKRAAGTINAFITAVKSFVLYLVVN